MFESLRDPERVVPMAHTLEAMELAAEAAWLAVAVAMMARDHPAQKPAAFRRADDLAVIAVRVVVGEARLAQQERMARFGAVAEVLAAMAVALEAVADMRMDREGLAAMAALYPQLLQAA